MGPGHVVSKIRLMDQQSPARVDKVAAGLEKGPARALSGLENLGTSVNFKDTRRLLTDTQV